MDFTTTGGTKQRGGGDFQGLTERDETDKIFRAKKQFAAGAKLGGTPVNIRALGIEWGGKDVRTGPKTEQRDERFLLLLPVFSGLFRSQMEFPIIFAVQCKFILPFRSNGVIL